MGKRIPGGPRAPIDGGDRFEMSERRGKGRGSKLRLQQALLLLCVVGVATAAACSDRGARDDGVALAAEKAVPDSVQQELERLGVEDQAIRQGLSPERMQDTAFAKRMLREDSARTRTLRSIVDVYGWPDSVRFGREAAQAAFLILQHSPVDSFQKEMLPTIEDMAEADRLPRSEAALLIDRVLMHEGLPQRYGTQFKLENGRLVLHPVEDEAGLEARRKTMGLPTMAEYMRVMEEVYKTPVAGKPVSEVSRDATIYGAVLDEVARAVDDEQLLVHPHLMLPQRLTGESPTRGNSGAVGLVKFSPYADTAVVRDAIGGRPRFAACRIAASGACMWDEGKPYVILSEMAEAGDAVRVEALLVLQRVQPVHTRGYEIVLQQRGDTWKVTSSRPMIRKSE
jgi:hypothetical protein